jgi:hypothetical protein
METVKSSSRVSMQKFRYYERIRLPQEPSLTVVQPGHPGQKYYVSWKIGNTGWMV